MPEGVLAIWAGAGSLPARVARNAVAEGRRVLAFAFPGVSDEAALRSAGASVVRVGLGRLGEQFRLMRREGVTDLVMIGKFRKEALFRGGFDATALRLLVSMPDLRDMTVFRALAAELGRRGVRVLPQTAYLGDWIAPEGILAGPRPPRKTLDDIRYGAAVARRLADLDIGQTVVVRRGMVVALEAAEGTDETILRVPSRIAKDAVVVKAARTRQDPRFDIPGVGLTTLASMRKAGLRTLAVEAGRCLVADREEFVRTASRWRISVWGWTR